MWVKQRKSRGKWLAMALKYWESVNADDKDSVDWRGKQVKPSNAWEGTMIYTKAKYQ